MYIRFCIHIMLMALIQSSLRDVLDLSYYVCEVIELSLAVVNGKGPSDFSPVYNINIHGGMHTCTSYIIWHYITVNVVFVDNFQLTYLEEDFRIGFSRQVVMEFEWNSLHNRKLSVTQYVSVQWNPYNPEWRQKYCHYIYRLMLQKAFFIQNCLLFMFQFPCWSSWSFIIVQSFIS